MTLEEAMNILLPGTPEENCPGFTGIGGIDRLAARDQDFVVRLQQWAEQFAPAQDVAAEALIRSFEASDFRAIRDAMLEIYFSHPAVVRAVRGTDAPLFPTGAEVAQIDFDLLGPVFERGEIFRKLP